MMLLQRHPQLLTLSLAQTLYWSCAIIGISFTALVGQRLSPWPLLSTLPLACLVVGNLVSIGFLARWMQRHGRSRGLQYGALLGVVAGLLATWSVLQGHFASFCIAMLLLGAYQASAGFYRFAALDNMAPEEKGRAASCVLAGGIAAALFSPSLAILAADLLSTHLAGAYLVIVGLALLAMGLLQCLPAHLKMPVSMPVPGASASSTKATLPLSAQRRALWQRPAIRQAIVLSACGHGLMILIMNATPLAMHHAGHSLASSTQVIQWHVLGMFLPSLIAGQTLDRFGSLRIAWCGAALLAGSALIAMTGQHMLPFLVSSVLLGVGWNLMLLAGTTLLSKACRPQEAPIAQPMMEWANNGCAALMSLSCGILIHTLGWQAINGFMLLVLLALAVLMLRQRPA